MVSPRSFRCKRLRCISTDAVGRDCAGGLGLEKDAPYSHWACVRDWDVEEQLACAARDGEYVCFKSEPICPRLLLCCVAGR